MIRAIRYTILVVCVMMSIPTTANAQVNPVDIEDPTPTFADTRWGSGPDLVRKNFSRAGFEYSNSIGDDPVFTGKVLGHNAALVARISPDHGLVKVRMIIEAEEQQLFHVYREMSSLLEEKYGRPSASIERYTSPYKKGDGYETQALRSGKATVRTYWRFDGDPAGAISLDILDKLSVEVCYESMRWPEEMRRRHKAF